MLHPVGDLPAGVYWRRRALVLGIAASVLGGGGWLAGTVGSTPDAGTQVAASTTDVTPSLAAPALEQVVPSLASGQTSASPTPDPSTAAPTTAAEPPAATTPPPTAASATPGPCSDDMITVGVVPAAAQVSPAAKPTFTLVVTNVSSTSCTRSMDAGLREIVLLDAAGARVWGSNDCFPETSTDPRTLAAGEAVSFPLQWGGKTSEPTCTVARKAPPPGSYALVGRLDTKTGEPTPLTLG